MYSRILGVLLMVTGILSGATASAGDYQATKKVGDLAVLLSIDKNPPVVGKNNVSISIKDSADNQITDASVRLEYSMAAMPGMPPMNYKSDAVASAGTYTTVISPSMAGSWILSVKVLRSKKIETAKFNIDVQ